MDASPGLVLLVALAPVAEAQTPGNGQPANNGGDALYFYGSPSAGAAPGAGVDLTGDLFWRAYAGWSEMDDVDPALGAVIEVVGYHELLYDTDWSTSPSFYVRAHGPALPDALGLGGLEPAFFQLGLTSEVIVDLGPSGYASPCTIAPSMCSPGGCPILGAIVGWEVMIELGGVPGAGVPLHADGTAASDSATTWFVPGGMLATGGPCGKGDYVLQDVHSTDETMADLTGNGVNPWGGYQVGGGGPVPDPLTHAAVTHVHLRGNVVRVVADSGTGLGVETSLCGGGGANGRALAVGGGLATLGVEISDNFAHAGDLAFVGASLVALPSPGVPFRGGHALIAPDRLFAATSTVWQGALAPSAGMGGAGLTMTGAQQPVPASAAGVVLHVQGAVLDAATLQLDTTGRVAVALLP